MIHPAWHLKLDAESLCNVYKKAERKTCRDLGQSDMWGNSRPKQGQRQQSRFSAPDCRFIDKTRFFSFSFSKTSLNPTNSHHMVNITVQVLSISKNKHLLSLVRVWEYSRMRTSLRMAETALQTRRGEAGITQNLWNTEENSLFYLIMGQRSNKAPAGPPSSLNTQNRDFFPSPVTTWGGGWWFTFCWSRHMAQKHRNQTGRKGEKKRKIKSLEFR